MDAVIAANVRRRVSLASLTCCLVALALAPAAAHARLATRTAPTFPTSVTVGDTNVAASITLENRNTAPNAGATNIVCNNGDPEPPCDTPERGIFLTPSCKQLSLGTCGLPDPGVVALSPTATGRVGTACAGMAFAVTLFDPVQGSWRFGPQPAGARVTLPGFGSSCVIDFTFDVLNAPVDQDPGTPGLQTAQHTGHTQVASLGTSGLSDTPNGTSSMTVMLAQPSIATTASPNIALGSGSLTDTATVSGRVSPVVGATIEWRLYGPDDATCADAPVFTTTSPYPVAGGAETSVAFTPTAPGTYRWRAFYSGDANNNAVSGPCNAPNENVDVNGTPGTNIAITKTASTSHVNGGDTFSYVLTVRNTGTNPAANVNVSDPVPSAVSILSTTPGAPTCTVSGQLVNCGFGTLNAGETRTITINARANGSAPVSTPGTNDHHIYVDKSETYVALDAGETREVDVTCNGGAIATDGSARVASVDQGTGNPGSVQVLTARAVTTSTYRFKLRNTATGRAQLQLYVTCLSATTVSGSPSHALVTGAPVSSTQTLAPGRRTITLAVPLGFHAIAPSFTVLSGDARLVGTEPTAGGWAMTFEVSSTAEVTASITPLRDRVAAADGHSHLLVFTHVERTVTVPAGQTVEATVTCADDAKGIVATYDVPDGVTVGHEPQPKSRVFRLYNGTSSTITAKIDVECLNDRTTGPTDDIGVVTNTATATTTSPDDNSADNAASAAIVIDRAAGGV